MCFFCNKPPVPTLGNSRILGITRFRETRMDSKTLAERAMAVRQNAYCPFSGFYVGAALVDENGVLHVGCNVENSAYPEGTCAEANAIASMIATGARRIVAIAIAGGHEAIENCSPCGGCRQKIAEFADRDTRIMLVAPNGEVHEHSVDSLLPLGFRLQK